jgi:UTP--glucose-1-phosphate uridylyltransferase
MKAVIPAAGKGTRFLPLTKVTPKEMLPVLNKPTIQYVVEEALAGNADEVIVISNDDKPSIRQHFSPDDSLLAYLDERGKTDFAKAVKNAGELPVSFAPQPEPLGLGHAVHCAAELTADDAFYVLLGDVIVPGNNVLPRMLEVSRAHDNASVIAVFKVPHEDVSRFGVIDGELISGTEGEGGNDSAVWKIRSLVEKPPADEAPSDYAVFGRYLLSPSIMDILAHTAPGAGNEIQLTDAMVELLKTEDMYAVEVNGNDGLDTGTVATWLDANIRMALRDPELAGVVRSAVA